MVITGYGIGSCGCTRKDPALVEIPAAMFLTVTGRGAPESAAFERTVGALYSVAYDPEGEAHAIFTSAGCADSFLATGHQDGLVSTFHGYEGEAADARRYSDGANTYWRNDWIMVRQGDSPVRVVASEIVRDAQPPLYPSGHYPVIADIVL